MTAARTIMAAATVVLSSVPSAVQADQLATWSQWQHIPGIFDVTGPRPDGSLLVAAGRRLDVIDPAGTITPLGSGPGAYQETTGGEAYIEFSTGLAVTGSSCTFASGDIFALRLQSPVGVTRIDATGVSHPFANVAGVDSLNGIVFDTVGRFGHRLLVTGPAHGKTAVVALGCDGSMRTLTSSAPALEGGLAVAPMSFGRYGGDLIAPDELSGRLLAIAPDGTTAVFADSGVPHGQDLGVEGVGFVPPSFTPRDFAYFADRVTANNPHPGTDSLLRIDGTALIDVGVQPGDLLAATEGGALMIAVRCAATCQVFEVASGPPPAHGEGHLVLVAEPSASASAAPTPTPPVPTSTPVPAGGRSNVSALLIALLLAIVLVGAAAVLIARRITRRS